MIAARLDDLERFGDMSLTDPPCYSASCSLVYRHMAKPTCRVFGDRSVRSKCPLTMRKLLDRAFREPGRIKIQPEDLSTEQAAHGATIDGSFQEVVAEQCRLRGGHFELVPEPCMVHFGGFNFASDEYWAYMEEKRAMLGQDAPVPR